MTGQAAHGGLAAMAGNGGGSDSADRVAANVGLLLTMFFWGSMIPVISALFATWDAPALSAVRYTIAIPLVLALVFAFDRAALTPGNLPIWRIWFIGGIGIAGFNTFYVLGIAFSGPITAAIIGPCSPLVAAFLARAFFSVPLTRGTGLALVLAVGGGLIAVVGRPPGGDADATLLGIAFLLISFACWTWYSLAGQRWLGHLSQLTLTAFTMTSAMVWLIAIDVVAVSAGWAEMPTAEPSAGAVVLMMWLAVSGSAIGVFLWNSGVKKLGVVVASMYLNLCPIIAVLVSIAFGARPSAWQLIGGAVVLAGVVQGQVRRARGKEQTGSGEETA
jgi:drug/metabolite transporter (DMT)-like permease